MEIWPLVERYQSSVVPNPRFCSSRNSQHVHYGADTDSGSTHSYHSVKYSQFNEAARKLHALEVASAYSAGSCTSDIPADKTLA